MIFMQTAGSAMFMGLAFSVYGESVIIFVQNIFIILLLWTYNKNIGILEKAGVIGFFAGYAYLLFVTPQMI